ncbi:MAG: TonB-dependent receptor, partial [Acidobacteria bacterium]
MKCTLLFLVLLFAALPALATVFGTVRGIVHDPQHRPVEDVTVTLKAKTSSYVQAAQTDANGEFHFDAVPLGEYRVTASAASFASEEQTIAVLSGTAPILHFELKLGSQTESITVSADAGPAQLESITPTTLVNRLEISDTPGASRTNSLALITDYVPGSFVVHDQLHVRGGHQVTWLIDGVAIPNSN